MSVQNLLRNLVTEAQLNQQQSLRSQKMKELAAAAPRGQAARLSAPSPIVRPADNSMAQGMSSLGKALGDIGDMRKESAAKDAFGALYEPTMVTDDMGGATAVPTSPKAMALMKFAVENSGTKAGASALQAAQFAAQRENQQATRENQLSLKRMEMQQKNLPKNATAAFLTKVDSNLGTMVSGNQIDPKIAMSIAQNPNALKLFKGGNIAESLQQANVEIDKVETVNIDGVNKKVGFTKTGSPIILGDAQKVAGKDVPLPPQVFSQKISLAEATGRAKGMIEMEMKKLDKDQKNDKAMVAILEATGILSSGDVTGSTIGNVFDNLAAVVGYSTLGAQSTSRLKLLQTVIMLERPRMEGQQSDRDVMLYEKAAADIGNANVPVETRQAALKTLARLMRKYRGQGSTEEIGFDIGNPSNAAFEDTAPPMPDGFVKIQ